MRRISSKLSPRIPRVLGHLLPEGTLKRPLAAESLDHGKAGVACKDEVRSGRIWQWDPFECRREDLIKELARFWKESMGKASACAHQMSPVTDVVGFRGLHHPAGLVAIPDHSSVGNEVPEGHPSPHQAVSCRVIVGGGHSFRTGKSTMPMIVENRPSDSRELFTTDNLECSRCRSRLAEPLARAQG